MFVSDCLSLTPVLTQQYARTALTSCFIRAIIKQKFNVSVSLPVTTSRTGDLSFRTPCLWEADSQWYLRRALTVLCTRATSECVKRGMHTIGWSYDIKRLSLEVSSVFCLLFPHVVEKPIRSMDYRVASLLITNTGLKEGIQKLMLFSSGNPVCLCHVLCKPCTEV